MGKTVMAALAATMLCGGANATVFGFNFSGNSGQTASFQIDTVATPAVDAGNAADFTVTGNFNTTQSTQLVRFFLGSSGGGFNVGQQAFIDTSGQQLFTGSTSNPIFSDGVFTLSGGFAVSTPGTLTIRNLSPSAAPEPVSWAMMIAGFGAIGASMRRRKVAVSFA